MNRLSFLKTIGVGIAVAVITPKIIMERHRPIKQTGGVIPFLVKQGKGIDIEKPWYFDELAKGYYKYYKRDSLLIKER